MTDDPLLRVPETVRPQLARLCDELKKAAGENLSGFIVFGGVASGRYVPGRSDVNAVVLLKRTGVDALGAIGPSIRSAQRSIGFEPMILGVDEVAHAADVFATKFRDIRARHLVLFGDDPFARLEVKREHLRLRIEQELRNLALRLRRRFVAIEGDEVRLAETLSSTVSGLAVQLGALLELKGVAIDSSAGPRELFAAAAQKLDLDGSLLEQLVELKEAPRRMPGLPALYERLLSTVRQATAIADALEGKV